MAVTTRAAAIAADLDRRIRENEFLPHTRLPTVEALAEEYATSPGTAHAVVKMLVRAGLVTTVRSYGAIVRDWHQPRRIRENRAVYLGDNGCHFDNTTKDWQTTGPSQLSWVAADDHTAHFLQIESGSEVFACENVSGDAIETYDGDHLITPQQINTTYVPAELARQVDLTHEETNPNHVLSQLDMAFGPLDFEDQTYARHATVNEAAQLQLGGHAVLVLGVAAVATDDTNRVVAVNDVRMDSRRWLLRRPLTRTAPTRRN